MINKYLYLYSKSILHPITWAKLTSPLFLLPKTNLPRQSKAGQNAYLFSVLDYKERRINAMINM